MKGFSKGLAKLGVYMIKGLLLSAAGVVIWALTFGKKNVENLKVKDFIK